MASLNDRDLETSVKASALTARETEISADGSKRRNHVLGDDTAACSSARRGRSIWVDVVLLVVLVAVIAGGVLGYRVVKNVYAPAWSERDIVFVVEISHVDPAILPEYWHADAPMYVSDKTDATPIGYLMYSPYIFADVENSGYVTVRLIMHAEARYRKSKGYYRGETPILAGLSGNLRVDGISGNGMITAVYEADEYATLIAATSANP